ncbi:hypothetical protein LguiA_013597 [Lonicera macranthoides]
MHSPFTQYATSSRMGVYDPINQMGMWGDFKDNGCLNTPTSVIIEADTKLDSQSEDNSNGTHGPCNNYDEEAIKPTDKVMKRLAKNREAARKSRLRKKAYVQQLETSRLKLLQLEQELEQVRQQGGYIGGGVGGGGGGAGHLGCSGTVRSGIGAFEREYGQWVKEQNRLTFKLRTALEYHLADEVQLGTLVNGGMELYSDLFRMKASAAKSDVFYLMTGMWRTSSERFLLWIGGFRPSELLKILWILILTLLWNQKLVLLPQLDLSDQQVSEVGNLRQSCQQAEDAISQGMNQLQQTVTEAVGAAGVQLCRGIYNWQVANALDRLEAVVSFVNQADHLRQETLQQMTRILAIPQQARALVALGDYFQSLRALSQLWDTRPHKPS